MDFLDFVDSYPFMDKMDNMDNVDSLDNYPQMDNVTFYVSLKVIKSQYHIVKGILRYDSRSGHRIIAYSSFTLSQTLLP